MIIAGAVTDQNTTKCNFLGFFVKNGNYSGFWHVKGVARGRLLLKLTQSIEWVGRCRLCSKVSEGVSSFAAIGQVAADPYISASAGVQGWLEAHKRLNSNVWKTLGVIQ